MSEENHATIVPRIEVRTNTWKRILTVQNPAPGRFEADFVPVNSHVR